MAKSHHVAGKRFVLTTVLMLLLISGCQGYTPAPSTPATSSPTTTGDAGETSITSTPMPTPQPSPLSPTETPISPLEVSEESLQGVQVSLWHPWTGDVAQALEGIISRFNAENEYGIQVQAQYAGSYDELSEQIVAAMEAGGAEMPTLAVAFSYWALEWEDVVDLTPYIEDPIWGMPEDAQDDFFSTFWEAAEDDGFRFGIPALRTADVLYYNQSWAEDLGFQNPPDTPEQFQRQACAASRTHLQDDETDNNGMGGWIVSHEYTTMLAWMQAYGAEVTTQNGYLFDAEPVIDSFTFLRGLYDLGCAWLPGEIDPQESFAGRGGLFATGTTTDIPGQQEAFQDAGNTDHWTVIPYPSPEGSPAVQAFGPEFVMLSSEPEQQLGGWLFLRWLMQAEQQAALSAVSYSLPLGQETRAQLEQNEELLPQYQAALALLSKAHPEPPFQSWGVVRWAVYDAGTQLYRFYYTASDAPELAGLLGATAEHLHEREP